VFTNISPDDRWAMILERIDKAQKSTEGFSPPVGFLRVDTILSSTLDHWIRGSVPGGDDPTFIERSGGIEQQGRRFTQLARRLRANLV